MLFLKAQPRRRAIRVTALVFFIGAIYLLTTRQLPLSSLGGGFGFPSGSPDYGSVDSSSNATLGFGRIYVISQEDSPRRESIIHAANVTELELNIPTQPVWTDEDEQNFRLEKDSTILKGSLLAWLGHIHALQQ